MSERVNMNEPGPELLPEHLRDPQARAQYESGKRAEMNQRLNEIQREMKANPDLYRLREGDDTVWVKNNRARSLAVGDLLFPGELNEDSDGPFQLVKRSDIDSNMKLTMMFEGEKPVLTQLTPDQYRSEYRSYLERLTRRKENWDNREITEAEKERRDDFTVRREILRNTPVDQG